MKTLLIISLTLLSTNIFAWSTYSLAKKLLKATQTKEKHSNSIEENYDSNLKYPDRGNTTIDTFSEGKRKLQNDVYGNSGATIYCGCTYQNKKVDLDSCGLKVIHNEKRATRLEWEHAVPAENFGRAFPEWREKKGCSSSTSSRKCAESNPTFNHMEADLYNLFPSEGEVNGLRSNYEYTKISSSKYDFGKCNVKLDDKTFEPRDQEKGMVARATLYMDWAYTGVFNLSDARRKLFEAWNKMYPVSEEECKFARLKKKVQGNENPFLKSCY